MTLIGREGDRRITMEEVADPACRFNYEMACASANVCPELSGLRKEKNCKGRYSTVY